jgi:hypothetical protein
MKTVAFIVVLTACLLDFSHGQDIVNSIALADGSASEGRLNVNVGFILNSTTFNTPVCGAVDVLTAILICQNLGYLYTSQYSTVDVMGIPSGTTPALIKSLSCVGIPAECTFEKATPDCTPSMNAAISCSLTPGQAAGISIGVLLLCLLVTCIPILICCCCCCGLCACATSGSRYQHM